ncbi:DNA recombination/repair protein RecA, partial [Bacillus tropicus]|nr:DNA recombination/repair protein RecA [Bacillus tropicus]
LIDIGVELDIVQKSGAWYSYQEERLGQGRDNAKQFLKENENIRNSVRNEIYEYYSPKEESIIVEEELIKENEPITLKESE